MWEGYEAFLVKIYLRAMLLEWKRRGYNGEKCKEHYKNLSKGFLQGYPCTPKFWHWAYFRSHQSNLVRKDPTYYRKFFPIVPDNLPYYWEKE